MVVASFVLVTFAAVSAAFHSIQRAMAETAAASGVQVAASGTPGDPNTPYLAGAYAPTKNLLDSVMFGTTIEQGTGNQASCGQGLPDATIQVCAYPDGALVGETIRGRPGFPIPWIDQLLPWKVDVTVEMHQVSYQP